MTARKAAHSLQRAKGALASGFATVDLHHAGGHDQISAPNRRCPGYFGDLELDLAASRRRRSISSCRKQKNCARARRTCDFFHAHWVGR